MARKIKGRGGKVIAIEVIDNRTGTPKQLPTPHGYGAKFAVELSSGQKITINGEVKKHLKGRNKGRPMNLTDTEAAFRSGYLFAQKQGAKAYKANKNNKSRYELTQKARTSSPRLTSDDYIIIG